MIIKFRMKISFEALVCRFTIKELFIYGLCLTNEYKPLRLDDRRIELVLQGN